MMSQGVRRCSTIFILAFRFKVFSPRLQQLPSMRFNLEERHDVRWVPNLFVLWESNVFLQCEMYSSKVQTYSSWWTIMLNGEFQIVCSIGNESSRFVTLKTFISSSFTGWLASERIENFLKTRHIASEDPWRYDNLYKMDIICWIWGIAKRTCYGDCLTQMMSVAVSTKSCDYVHLLFRLQSDCQSWCSHLHRLDSHNSATATRLLDLVSRFTNVSIPQRGNGHNYPRRCYPTIAGME